jgi:hypothetical protein
LAARLRDGLLPPLRAEEPLRALVLREVEPLPDALRADELLPDVLRTDELLPDVLRADDPPDDDLREEVLRDDELRDDELRDDPPDFDDPPPLDFRFDSAIFRSSSAPRYARDYGTLKRASTGA